MRHIALFWDSYLADEMSCMRLLLFGLVAQSMRLACLLLAVGVLVSGPCTWLWNAALGEELVIGDNVSQI